MTETKKRSLHPAELRVKMRLDALVGMKTINQIAQAHDVHPQLLQRRERNIQDRALTGLACEFAKQALR